MLTLLLELANVPDLLTVAKNAKDANLTTTAITAYVFLCLSSAGLVWFLQMTMEKGQLLRRYHAWIFKTFWYSGRRRVSYHAKPHLIAFCEIPESHLGHGDWPLRRLYKIHAPTGVHNCNPRCNIYWPLFKQYHPAKWWQKLYKPLGGCPYCMAPYVGTIFYILIIPHVAPVAVAVLVWPLFVGLQYVFIELIKPYTQYA